MHLVSQIYVVLRFSVFVSCNSELLVTIFLSSFFFFLVFSLMSGRSYNGQSFNKPTAISDKTRASGLINGMPPCINVLWWRTRRSMDVHVLSRETTSIGTINAWKKDRDNHWRFLCETTVERPAKTVIFCTLRDNDGTDPDIFRKFTGRYMCHAYP